MCSLTDNKSVGTDKGDRKKKKAQQHMASASEVLSFVFACGSGTRAIFFLGWVGGIGNGMVYPILAYLFSTSFSSIAGASDGLAQVREVAYTFMIVGVFALVMATIQTGCFEIVANRGTKKFRRDWFRALLRQDTAFFDVYDVAGIANSIGPQATKFRRGIGKKFGEGIQFFTTFVAGIGYALYSSWQVALLIIAALPLVSFAALATVSLNQKKGSNASAAYGKAGSVAYSAVSAIRTVLSLNAAPEMIRQYAEATLEAFKSSKVLLAKMGFANGSMLGSFLLLYCVLALFGTFLIYRDVEDTGCDPSDGVEGNETCKSSGPDVFGAMLGVAFAAQGLSQVGNFFEAFTAARIACYAALKSIQRVPGAPEETILEDDEEGQEDSEEVNSDEENGNAGPRIKAILPKYAIDSSSESGQKPSKISGRINFKNVDFFYPRRPGTQILKGFNLDIEAGKTVAIVGPSGGGKSTTVSMIERFYDPVAGVLEIDGIDIRDYNLHYLRSKIGYVGQEPTLFAGSIADNIRYGNPGATQKQIEAAAKMANAHDFISSFPDGYETQVGDKGAQLSGGQKQRIALSRVLVANPSILLLDEATSALDSESEIVVQDALDNVVSEHKRTTVIIAHRLSTIRNVDYIYVVADGVVVEKGTHEELMSVETGQYRALVMKQERRGSSLSLASSRDSSYSDLEALETEDVKAKDVASDALEHVPHFHFKDVLFSYPTRPNKKVLSKFNLSIRRGETIGLVGPSGGGKSTIVSLIERFYDPKEGCVEYEGVDVRSLNVRWYRDQIGYVGQEPTLFNTTIAKNIAYGAPGVTRKEIEEAAIQANAHDFIMSFPRGYDTEVGEGGSQLSGGQKQRVCIVRALVKKPKVLILDEATSALDSQSESIVQESLDKLMKTKDHTTIVIAHRLSTIQECDRIAFVSHGHVREFGSHYELMQLPHGRYKRLVESQRRGSVIDAQALKQDLHHHHGLEDEEEEEPDFKTEIEEAEKKAFSASRARQMAQPDVWYMLLGSLGAALAGGVFPVWGVMFAETIELLFRRIPDCQDETVEQDFGFATCQEYWDFEAQQMRDRSFELGAYWVVLAAGCVLGNLFTFYGFGMASERLNKRVRDSAFTALLRQEVAFFDKRSVGTITSQLEEDAARIHTFSGEPVRSLLTALSSVLTGIILSFVFMWPFALLAIACIPVMGFATSIEMKQFLGEDESQGNKQDDLNSSGGIAVETLLNMRTVAALTLEKKRLQDFEEALAREQPHYVRASLISGAISGLSMLIQQWVNALQLWWGGYLLFNYSDKFGFNDFLISMFALLFSLFGLGAAFQGLSDKKETEKSAGRIFYLLDRESAINPLSDEGKKLD